MAKPPPSKKSPPDESEAQDALESVGKLKSEVSDMKKTLHVAEDFGQLFITQAGKNVQLKEFLEEQVRRSISSNEETGAVIKKKMQEINKDAWLVWGRQLGFLVWSLILLAAGGVIHALIAKLIP